jgi:hypothetical protein
MKISLTRQQSTTPTKKGRPLDEIKMQKSASKKKTQSKKGKKDAFAESDKA